MSSNTTSARFRVADDRESIEVRKVFTRMGERLELTASTLGESIALDAIGLEAVAWQDASDLAEKAAAAYADAATDEPADEGEADGPDEPVTVSNEYAFAELTVESDDGREYLRIRAPKLGHEIRLSASQLGWLTLQDHETITEFLEEPFGPEDEHDHGH